MKKAVIILGIIILIIGIISLLLGGLFWYASKHTLDGSASLYLQQRKMMLIAFLIGILLLIVSVVLLRLSKKMH